MGSGALAAHYRDATDMLSALRLLSPSLIGTNVTLTWQSVEGVNYFLECSTNLAAPFTVLASNILGQACLTSYSSATPSEGGPFFFRVGVR